MLLCVGTNNRIAASHVEEDEELEPGDSHLGTDIHEWDNVKPLPEDPDLCVNVRVWHVLVEGRQGFERELDAPLRRIPRSCRRVKKDVLRPCVAACLRSSILSAAAAATRAMRLHIPRMITMYRCCLQAK